MFYRFVLILVSLLAIGCQTTHKPQSQSGPWNVRDLERAPKFYWGTKTGLVQQVYYRGEPFQEKPTHVFAYLGRPARGQGPFPAVVLVHGGGGKAFKVWAEHWAQRGYVSLAMDL